MTTDAASPNRDWANKKRSDSIFSNLHWTPKPIDPIDPKLNGIQMAQVDKTKRQKVCDQISSAADQLLQELSVNTVVRKALMLFYIHGQIKKILSL